MSHTVSDILPKDYVAARGFDDSVISRQVYFKRKEGILWNSYVTADTQLRTNRALYSIVSALWNYEKEIEMQFFADNYGGIF